MTERERSHYCSSLQYSNKVICYSSCKLLAELSVALNYDLINSLPKLFSNCSSYKGKVVSGWKVENSDSWELIGKQDPQQPQMFYPVNNPELSLTRGDVVAARCTMANTRDRTTFVGATKEDEMCNFYIMYWVEGDSPMEQTTCISAVEIQ